MSRRIHRSYAGLVAATVLGSLVLAGCEAPPVTTVQRGYRGTGMIEVYNPAAVKADLAKNQPPQITPTASPDGPKAGLIYQNVKVLKDLSVGQFAGLMVDMTNWVAPTQGCSYCHVAANFADDTLYTKVVARRMLQMTQRINASWKPHVQNTGVTCYTCHRGNNVPTNIWYKSADAVPRPGMLGNKDGQNSPAPQIGYASLPNDVFSKYLEGADPIRVMATSALPEVKGVSIKNAESTYGLMMHMSKALGVNCTYCHNSRSFASWEMSTPQRAVAYYGIRMARELNTDYLDSLKGVFPAHRLGPLGDVPKLNCATCHQGAYKPLYGANILNGYPGLAAAASGPATAVVTEVVPGSPNAASTSPAATGTTSSASETQSQNQPTLEPKSDSPTKGS